MQIVVGCENYLGWQPPSQSPSLNQARCLEVFKLKRAIASGNPRRGITVEEIALALDYSRRKRLPVTSPLALLHRIPQALALAYRPTPVSDLAAQIAEAIDWERDRDDPDSLRWIYQLTRAHGPGRVEALEEWRTAGRG